MTASDTLKNLQIRQTQQPQTRHTLLIGWAEADITPHQPVSLSGHFELRISEGVANPLSVTAWTIENGSERAVFVGCDIVTVPDDLRDDVRARLKGLPDAPDPCSVILHATHTHYAPEVHVRASIIGHTSAVGNGVELDEISPDIMAVEAYAELLAERITQAILEAWRTRAPGGVSYGHGFAVIGRNRRWVDREGRTTMHGLNESTAGRFRYIDGYEDHALNVMATYNAEAQLTGLIVNFACPAQTPGNPAPNRISADFWHEIRVELRLFIWR